MLRLGGGGGARTKRIGNNRRVPLLHELFPDARYVSITRDGRAVAYSLSRVDWWEDLRVWWDGGTPRRLGGRGQGPVGDVRPALGRGGARDRRRSRDVPAEQVLHIAYEDFVASPRDTLARVAEHMGLDGASAGWSARLAGLDFPDRNESWRSSMGPEDVATVERWQGDLLGQLGYGLVGSPGAA